VNWLGGDFDSPFLGQSVCLLIAHTKVTLSGSLSFPSTCIHSQTRDDSVVVFASAARAALLSEHVCILLLTRFVREVLYTSGKQPPECTIFCLKYLFYIITKDEVMKGPSSENQN
jgi:hypothetical protein